jgi:hypothetical protein
VVLGVAMVAETLLLLWFSWSKLDLGSNHQTLHTFSFLLLLYFGAFSVVSARERRGFWATLPSKTFLAAIAADAIIGTLLTYVGLPGLTPLAVWQTGGIFLYASIACLVVNDALKVELIKWGTPKAVA